MENLSAGQRTRFDKGTRLDPLYLLDISYNVGVKELVWSICGSTRNIYTVSLKNRRMWCNCPDMKSHCSAQGVVCKHVVFALWKVGKYREWSYFDTKTIDDAGYEFLLNSALERDTLFSDRTIVDRDLVGQFERLGFSAAGPKVESGPSIIDESALAQASALAQPLSRHIEETDECPVCYDVLLNATPLDACKTCKNSIHKECLQKWIQFNRTCVYCRSQWTVVQPIPQARAKPTQINYQRL